MKPKKLSFETSLMALLVVLGIIGGAPSGMDQAQIVQGPAFLADLQTGPRREQEQIESGTFHGMRILASAERTLTTFYKAISGLGGAVQSSSGSSGGTPMSMSRLFPSVELSLQQIDSQATETEGMSMTTLTIRGSTRPDVRQAVIIAKLHQEDAQVYDATDQMKKGIQMQAIYQKFSSSSSPPQVSATA